MTIEKTPNGTWRIREMVDGKRYSITVKEKPTKKEAEMLIHVKIGIKKEEKKQSASFFDCAYEYIEMKDNVISPTTIRLYHSMLSKSLSSDFTKKCISDITQADVQKEINIYSINHAPKTVRNLHGFISAVFAVYEPSMQLCTTLPKKAKNKAYIPTADDVKRIFEYAKDSNYEIALKLCAMGLRRSEMCALTLDDLDGNTIVINKALVQDQYKKWVIKTPKTTESERYVVIPNDLADLIREKGSIYTGHPNSVDKYLKKAEKELGIEKFSLHKLRHYYASSAHAMGIPDAYIQEAGGWKTDTVLKQVYRHALTDQSKEMQQKIADSMSALY